MKAGSFPSGTPCGTGYTSYPRAPPRQGRPHTPFNECAAEFPCAAETIASIVAPTHITVAPPRTPAHRRQPACRNSLKNRKPQKMPRRLFEFHSGKAMLNPMSRIAKIVSVFATAHKQPANSAQIIKCGARSTSARTDDVPRANAGKLHRARKTPTTIISEITIGDTPIETSLVGASAAPSQAPAVKPQSMPSSCRRRCRTGSCGADSWEELGGADANSAGTILRENNQ